MYGTRRRLQEACNTFDEVFKHVCVLKEAVLTAVPMLFVHYHTYGNMYVAGA